MNEQTVSNTSPAQQSSNQTKSRIAVKSPQTESNVTDTSNVPPEPVKKPQSTVFLFILILALLGIFVYGLRWVFSLGAEQIGSAPFLVFDYAVGLTMIFLPCTLPLAFVIVPLVMGKSYQKGIGMVLAFGLGVSITLSLYGALIGFLGQILGVHQVELAKNILYVFAGLLAILFALGELKLINFKSPTYGGGVPQVIMKQKDLAKAFLLGLFLGNVGVGCPNPLFNAVIIPQIIATGSPFQGWVIMLVQALGRITPLFILAFLAILGINATSFLVRHKDKVAQLTAWTTLFVGGFLLTLGLFGHDWWVLSGIHSFTEKLTQEEFITNLLGSKVKELGHTHGIPAGTWLFGLPLTLGTPFMILVWLIPMLWYWLQRKKNVVTLDATQQPFEQRYLRLLGLFFIAIASLLIVVFGYLLPHMFAEHWSKMGHEEEMSMENHMMKKQVIEEQDFHATLSSTPSAIQAGKLFTLKIKLHDKNGNPINDLQISHERILHVVLVSEDLEEFMHVHPEDFEGSVTTPKGEFSFPFIISKAGRYRVLVDGNRLGKEVSATNWINVTGSSSSAILIEKNLSLDKIFDKYKVVLHIQPKNPKSGEAVHLNYYIERNGKQVLDTDKYLGADMHLLIAPLDLSVMSHTHGLKPTPTQGNTLDQIDAHYVFPFPGIWKIYGQFKHKGKVITNEFMIEVAQGMSEIKKMTPHMDEHTH